MKLDAKIPEALNTPGFVAAWTDWLHFTEERGVGLSMEDQNRQLTMLKGLEPDKAIQDIRNAMNSHPLKDDWFVGQAKKHQRNGETEMHKKGAKGSKPRRHGQQGPMVAG